jgi:hypothetical protein
MIDGDDAGDVLGAGDCACAERAPIARTAVAPRRAVLRDVIFMVWVFL